MENHQFYGAMVDVSHSNAHSKGISNAEMSGLPTLPPWASTHPCAAVPGSQGPGGVPWIFRMFFVYL
jgi:hypothetical protein